MNHLTTTFQIHRKLIPLRLLKPPTQRALFQIRRLCLQFSTQISPAVHTVHCTVSPSVSTTTLTGFVRLIPLKLLKPSTHRTFLQRRFCLQFSTLINQGTASPSVSTTTLTGFVRFIQIFNVSNFALFHHNYICNILILCFSNFATFI